ncbi:cytochrome P450 2L1-like [Macrobrachium nipponense]|uniref:cytochrome P450 2L1-like n=1 Tax=Macrobrachium nipponense TaxID=159736 RepID=UPI0030C83D22
MILEIILFLSLVLILRHWLKRTKGLPPGPLRYPIFGSGFTFHLKKVEYYQKKYGDVFMLEFAGRKLLYICDYKLMKDALGRTEFSDRPNLERFHFMTDGRESGLRYDLHDEEVCDFIKIMKRLQEDAFGFFILETCPILKKILPKYVINKFFRMEILDHTVAATKKLFGKTIEARKAELDINHAENVIDEYLIQMNDKTEIAEFFNEEDLMTVIFDLFSAGFETTSIMLRWMILYAAKYPDVQKRVQEQIDEVVPRGEFPTNQHKSQSLLVYLLVFIMFVLSLFVVNISWLFLIYLPCLDLLLCLFFCYTTGPLFLATSNGHFNFRLPLLEAFIHEVLRVSSLLPYGVLHATGANTHLAGYLVPKGALVFAVSGFSHQDPRYWESSQEFRIERFLDEEGKFIPHKEGFTPFSIGKRNCLGESLARMELSIFSAALFQNFTFSPLEGREIDLTPQNAPLVNLAQDQGILISARN